MLSSLYLKKLLEKTHAYLWKAESRNDSIKIESLGLQPEECAMVGDRIYTDMEMAKQAKVVSILVLSGEATLEDLNDGHEIDIIVSSVDKLLR